MSELTTAELYEMLGDPVEVFKPFAFYNADGDCIEFFAKGERYYGERVDNYVTVYRSMQTNEIIGSIIKNVKELCKTLSASNPQIEIVVADNRICIQHLFFLWWVQHADSTPVYQTLTELAVNNHIGEVRLSA